MSRFIYLLLVFSLVFVSGCWDLREAAELEYVQVCGIDLNEKGHVVLTIQTPVLESLSPKSKGKAETSKSISISGKTTAEAAFRYVDTIGRELFWGHLQVLVIGEEAAKKGVTKYFDFFAAQPRLRGIALIALVKGRAKDIVEAKPDIHNNPSTYFLDQLKTSIYNGAAPVVQISALNRMLADPEGGQPMLPVIRLFEQNQYDRDIVGIHPSEQGKMQSPLFLVEGTGVFHHTKLVGYLDRIETRGLLWTREIKNVIVPLPCKGDDCNISMQILSNQHVNKKVTYKNGKALIEIKLTLTANIADKSSNNAELSEDLIHNLEKQVNNQVKREIQHTFSKVAKQLHVDVFGFGNVLNDQNPKVWEKVKDEWEEAILSHAELKIQVDTKIRRSSRNLYSPWMQKKK